MKILSLWLAVLMAAFWHTAAPLPAQSPVLKVFVSIAPQQYFVERVGGDRVHCQTMVQPGHSPATYDPTAGQMAALADAQLYFRIGVPFETAWLDKIKSVNDQLQIIDTRKGIQLRRMDMPARLQCDHNHDHDHHHGHQHDHGDGNDPHIWLDPDLVKTQADTICQWLSASDPGGAEIYAGNLADFKADLTQLDQDIRQTLQGLPSRTVMVYHPSWGYFCDAYDLTQVPIEAGGKEPSARELASIIQLAKDKNIRLLVVQQQFDQRNAQLIAAEINATVLTLNPLASDYLKNMREIARAIADQMP